MMTIKQAAGRLSVSEGTVRNLCASGELPHRRIGLGRGCIRIAEEDLKEYLERVRVGGEEEIEDPPPAPKPVKLKHLSLD